MKFFDLQLFADGETTGADAAENGAQGESAKPDAGGKAAEPKQKPESGKKYTDADVNAIIDRKFAEWQIKQQKAVDEAAKLAEMNAQEKAEYERDELRKELDALKKQSALAGMMKTARKMLSDAGISASDELLSMLVNENAESTKSAVDGFAAEFKKAVDAAVKDRLRGDPPKRGSGGGAAMTKEQILAIKDTDLRQQKMLENKHLFNL